MSKTPSIVRQVTRVFASIERIGESRHAAKAAGTATAQIHSYASAKTHRQRVITGLRRINSALPPDQRIRLLRDLRPEHVELLKRSMIADGLADSTIRNELSSWRKLSHALNAAGWSTLKPDELVPSHLYNDLGQSRPRGGYSSDQVKMLISHIERTHRSGIELARMARLIATTGLRHQEVARLREADLDRTNGDILVRGSNAKGGRTRLISLSADGPCRTALRDAINAIPEGRNWLWNDGPRIARQLQDAIRDACDHLEIEPKGLHGLRATFAETYIRERLATGLDEKTARSELTVLLGHGRISVTYRYAQRIT